MGCPNILTLVYLQTLSIRPYKDKKNVVCFVVSEDRLTNIQPLKFKGSNKLYLPRANQARLTTIVFLLY